MRLLSTVRTRVAATVAVAVLGSTVGATYLAYQLERSSEQSRFTSAADNSSYADLQQATTIAKAQPTTAKAITAVRSYIEQRGLYSARVVDGIRPYDSCDQPYSCLYDVPASVGSLLEQGSGDGIWYDSGRQYVVVRSIERATDSRVGLVEVFDFTDARRQLTRLRNDLLWLDAIGLGVAILLGLVVANGISRPVRRTARAAKRLGDGDLDTRIPVRGSGELAELATNFNAMAEWLSETLRDLRASQTLQQRFVADVSHELRTPLAAMLAAGEGMTNDDPHVRDRAVELVRAQTRRMSTMVEHLLEMSRFDAGQAALELESVQLTDLVDDVIHTVASDADVRVTAFGDTTSVLDARRVHTILRNLVGNARQHGEPPIDVIVDGRGDPIVITVVDDGPGIPPELTATIFDRFVRADTARSGGEGGSTGLGLAIAAEHARVLGAWLEVSTNGRTAFSLHVPRREHADRV